MYVTKVTDSKYHIFFKGYHAGEIYASYYNNTLKFNSIVIFRYEDHGKGLCQFSVSQVYHIVSQNNIVNQIHVSLIVSLSSFLCFYKALNPLAKWQYCYLSNIKKGRVIIDDVFKSLNNQLSLYNTRRWSNKNKTPDQIWNDEWLVVVSFSLNNPPAVAKRYSDLRCHP